MTNVVLVPGILGFERFGPLQYFNGIAGHLQQTFPGLRVESMTTNPIGTVADRADLLARQIADTFGDSEPVHILAHSMGGLDARLVVASNLRNVGARIKTVVCIGTPHLGSPVASVAEIGNPLDVLTALLKLNGAFVDELRAKANAVHDLSEAGAAQLDRDCPDKPGVRYLEIAGAGRDAVFHTSAFFAATFLFIHSVAGRNDGVVPMTSAQRGRPLFATWAADHADMIGHDLNGPTPFSVPSFPYLRAYEQIIRDGVLS
jgi:pimeloyl-ACP methyl ester carboxylesterase